MLESNKLTEAFRDMEHSICRCDERGKQDRFARSSHTAGAEMVDLRWCQTVIVTAESDTGLLTEVAAQHPSIKLLQTFQFVTSLSRPHRLSIFWEQSCLPSTPIQQLIIMNSDDFETLGSGPFQRGVRSTQFHLTS